MTTLTYQSVQNDQSIIANSLSSACSLHVGRGHATPTVTGPHGLVWPRWLKLILLRLLSETGGTPHDHSRSASLNKASAHCCRPALRARSPEYSLTRGAMADSVECRVSCRGVGRGARQLVRGGLVVGGCVLVSGRRASCGLLWSYCWAVRAPVVRWKRAASALWWARARARRELRAAVCS